MFARAVVAGTGDDEAFAVLPSLGVPCIFSSFDALFVGADSGAVIWMPEIVAVGTAGSNDAGWALRADARCASRYKSSMDFRGGR